MKRHSIITLIFFATSANGLYGQNTSTEKVLTLNFINPGIDFERPLGKRTTTAINAGVGYGVSYPKLSTFGAPGFLFMIAPFVDLQTRVYYNLARRNELGKNTKMNSGNFYGLRFLSRGREFDSNFIRDNDLDFAIGPVWGIKRAYNRINLIFNMGPIIYWDRESSGFLPLTFELNLGYILTRNGVN